MYIEENQVKPESIEIQEMSLQGVYPLEQEKQKVWRSKEDKTANILNKLVQDKGDGDGFKGIALEAQRMRTF